ncbi:hypothetical protein WS67_14175 [Burkholderia singularis]|uniref:Uncharacterized protein n=1 Tax=Burkholderia singularis TaxID=1503053 RepID=A0A103E1M6_9BURK|nr:hypothetical protein WS67_14175 [Burkholderia singularis]
MCRVARQPGCVARGAGSREALVVERFVLFVSGGMEPGVERLSRCRSMYWAPPGGAICDAGWRGGSMSNVFVSGVGPIARVSRAGIRCALPDRRLTVAAVSGHGRREAPATGVLSFDVSDAFDRVARSAAIAPVAARRAIQDSR